MNEHQPPKRAVTRTMLAGGIALACLGLGSGTAQAAPDVDVPSPGLSEVGGLLAECSVCMDLLPSLLPVLDQVPLDSLPGGFELPGLG